MTHRQEKIESLLQIYIAESLNREAGTKSVITVTDCHASPDLKNVTAFITVLPEQYEEEALNFAKRKRPEIRNYIKDHLKMKTLPFVEIEIDQGEKNRQRIDGLMSNL